MKNSCKMHCRFCLLIFLSVLLFLVSPLQAYPQTYSVPDTTKVNGLFKKGKKLHYSHPDSAIYYYQLINTDFRAFKPKQDYENISDIEKAYLKTVIRAINRTGNIYYYNDEYMRSEMYYQQSLKIAKQAGLTDFTGKALFDIGYIRYMNNDYTSAKKLFKESYGLYTESAYQYGMYEALNACGLSESHLGDFYAADSCFSEALNIAISLNDSTLISDIKIHLGILNCEQEKLEEGIILFGEALDYYEKTGDKDAISDALLNIGVVMKMVGENDRALAYIKESTRIEELSQVKSQLVTRYYQLADLYLQMNDNEKAFEYCQKTLTVAGEIASKPFVADCNFLMGKYFLLEKKYPEAINHFSTALNTAETTNNKTLIANIYLWYANAYVQLNRFNEAIALADKAYTCARELSLISLQKEASYTLFKSFEKTGNLKKALNWFEIYHNVSDSVNYFDQQKEIRRIEASYNYEKKERENELLRNRASLQEQKLKNRTTTLFALFLGIILSIVVIILLVIRIKYARALNREQQMLSLEKLEDINKELDGKKRELASKMMFLNQKNELIGRIINQLQELQNSPDINYSEINTLVNELRTDAPQSNWKEFETQFVQVHPDFYKRLYEKYPKLTSYEQRISAFLRMNLNTKEIASITARSPKSIEVTRSRIRKKLKLSRRDNLSSFLASI